MGDRDSTRREYDFVALGAGIGGITAALVAHEAGLSPVVLEKSDQVGGVAAYSGGQVWVPGNHLAERDGIRDTWQEGHEYLRWVAENDVIDDRLLRTLCEQGRLAL